MLLVVCQLSRDVIGYEDSHFNSSVVTVKQSFIVIQFLSCAVVLSWVVLLDSVNKLLVPVTVDYNSVTFVVSK